MEEKKKKAIIIITGIIVITIIGIILYMNDEEQEYTDFNVLEEIISTEDNNAKENNTKDNNIENKNRENDNKNVNNVENNQENQNEIGNNDEIIAIHITGQVKKPGILYLKLGSRIADAIQEAGGATKNADLDRVNLAYILSDGQKIYIPSKNEKEEEISYIISNSGENILVEEGNNKKEGVNEKVNINTATQTELEELPGIGPSLAQRIIEYRETNGNFQSIEDLQNVKGIGDSKYGNIKDHVCI